MRGCFFLSLSISHKASLVRSGGKPLGNPVPTGVVFGWGKEGVSEEFLQGPLGLRLRGAPSVD